MGISLELHVYSVYRVKTFSADSFQNDVNQNQGSHKAPAQCKGNFMGDEPRISIYWPGVTQKDLKGPVVYTTAQKQSAVPLSINDHVEPLNPQLQKSPGL